MCLDPCLLRHAAAHTAPVAKSRSSFPAWPGAPPAASRILTKKNLVALAHAMLQLLSHVPHMGLGSCNWAQMPLAAQRAARGSYLADTQFTVVVLPQEAPCGLGPGSRREGAHYATSPPPPTGVLGLVGVRERLCSANAPHLWSSLAQAFVCQVSSRCLFLPGMFLLFPPL